jgi:phenylpropionate dioxygenase-like ring-hydroxylating dioxygenase large terminal subunit
MRGKDGTVRAFHNVCAHRGNKVIPESGNETFGTLRANVVSCRFHGWVFATDGTVRSIPREENFADLNEACLSLRPIHCAIWEGFIFVNFSETPEQGLTDYLGGIGKHFAGYAYGEAIHAYRYFSVLECNWKVALYAFTEGYHVPTIHAGTFPSLARLEQTAFKRKRRRSHSHPHNFCAGRPTFLHAANFAWRKFCTAQVMLLHLQPMSVEQRHVGRHTRFLQ